MSRQFAITSDIHGIDPLKDKVAESLRTIKGYQEHVVTEDEVGHSGLLALRYYQDETLGYIILEYNALGHELNMVKGSTIKIPNLNELKAKTQVRSRSGVKTKRTVSI